MRCEVWRRYGGAFTFGPVRWEQCKNDAIVSLTVQQDGQPKTCPVCMKCWREAISNEIEIKNVVPLEAGQQFDEPSDDSA
jgi:hypothetical protein